MPPTHGVSPWGWGCTAQLPSVTHPLTRGFRPAAPRPPSGQNEPDQVPAAPPLPVPRATSLRCRPARRPISPQQAGSLLSTENVPFQRPSQRPGGSRARAGTSQAGRAGPRRGRCPSAGSGRQAGVGCPVGVAPGSSRCPTQTDLSEPPSPKLKQGRTSHLPNTPTAPRERLSAPPLPSPAVESRAANRPQRLHASVSPSMGITAGPGTRGPAVTKPPTATAHHRRTRPQRAGAQSHRGCLNAYRRLQTRAVTAP